MQNLSSQVYIQYGEPTDTGTTIRECCSKVSTWRSTNQSTIQLHIPCHLPPPIYSKGEWSKTILRKMAAMITF